MKIITPLATSKRKISVTLVATKTIDAKKTMTLKITAIVIAAKIKTKTIADGLTVFVHFAADASADKSILSPK